MNYGVPYQGSKNRIAKDIVGLLPEGQRFVDLFAGGCAITHAAILSGKYKRFLCIDLYPHGSNLFKNALNGEYSKPEYLRWISREEFFAKKDTDEFVKLCYSFGNGGTTYMYSKELEPLKKAFHYAVVFNDWAYLEQYAKENNWREGLIDELKKSVEGIDDVNERRLKMTKPAFDNEIIGLPHNRLQHLEHINRLESLDISTEQQIEFTSFDYKDYQHEEGDVVYCDPPYSGTKGYDGREFDHAAFWEWVRTRDYPVYVSEYNAPEDFICMWQKEKMRLGGGGNSNKYGKALEKVFVHQRWRIESV